MLCSMGSDLHSDGSGFTQRLCGGDCVCGDVAVDHGGSEPDVPSYFYVVDSLFEDESGDEAQFHAEALGGLGFIKQGVRVEELLLMR